MDDIKVHQDIALALAAAKDAVEKITKIYRVVKEVGVTGAVGDLREDAQAKMRQSLNILGGID